MFVFVLLFVLLLWGKKEGIRNEKGRERWKLWL